MDKNMHRAMDSDKFPQISFVIKSYQVKDSDVTAQGKPEHSWRFLRTSMSSAGS